MPVDHEFGSVSTDLKLSMVEGYLSAFTRALRPKFGQLWYIDAFAGTGNRTIRHAAQPAGMWTEAVEARVERRRGSAEIALHVSPAFDRLIFIEKKKSHYEALLHLKAAHPHRKIDVARGDANELVLAALKGQSWAGVRAVMFLDPYGMHLDWTTLEAIRQTKAIDIWYLVSLSGLYRQAPRDRGKLSEQKRSAITRTFGTSRWEQEWYPQSKLGDLFADLDDDLTPAERLEGPRRVADVSQIEAFALKRLRDLFPAVLPPLRLHNDSGSPMFSLFFATSNDDPKAIGLASKIAGHILASGRASHVRKR